MFIKVKAFYRSHGPEAMVPVGEVIVLNHIGGLVRVGSYANHANRDNTVLAEWRRGLAAVAARPNVVLKLGGVG